ncbi:MAG TPA: DedA family protein [Gemmatimonadaceae bacterium]|nr:DedA family protein [Gemmatimonadaceae bacterium]
MLQGLLDWLTSLPPAALYLALAATAAAENIFPPLPADTVVAFGSFIAARGHGSAVGSFLSTWVGNVAGAMFMYALGRRFGAEWVLRKMAGGGAGAEARLQSLYSRRGIWAIVISRFLPAVRAVVPPFAGALRVPALRAMVAMALPSGLWYGIITYLAFRVGSSWEELSARVAHVGRWIGIGAVVLVVIAAAVFLVRRKRAA